MSAAVPTPTTKEFIGGWHVALLYVSFILLFLIASPVYYLNRWDLLRHIRRNPFYTSALMRLETRFPLLYDAANYVDTFPLWHHIYDVLPSFSGDVLQVGCGTGVLNKLMRHRSDIRFTNLDTNIRALRTGRFLKRYSSYLHGSIEHCPALPDASFDVIIFGRCFHHIRNHRKTFAECARLLRDGGRVIITDPIMLCETPQSAGGTAYMANSSIDGVIWRFTLDAFVKHLSKSLPGALAIYSVDCVRQAHITNYNPLVPHTDVVAVLTKGIPHHERQDHSTHRPGQE
jgi:SAM-dependent methyltransferase